LTIQAGSWYHQPAKNQPRAGHPFLNKEKHISATDFRVNESIRAAEVRLIDAAGENVGVVATKKALEMARQAELDLVEVAPNADPPVCRIMDFGKFVYERAKKEKEARKAQTKIEIKEIRLRPKTNEHHRGFKVKDARRWLENGMKVKVTIRFRGREMDYPEIALEDLKEIAQELSDISVVEQAPQMEGRTMLVVLAPGKAKKKEKTEPEEEKESAEA
jgi:translation initiation factor IF-3